MRMRAWLLPAYCGLLVCFLFAPIIIVVVFSFAAGGTAAFPITGWTTDWYEAFFDNPVMVAAAKNSAYVALGTAGIVLAIGALAGAAIARARSRLATPATIVIALPVVLPPLLVGVALLSFFTKVGVTLSLGTVVIAHALLTLPFVALTMAARFASLDPSLGEAAAVLGANRSQTFRHVTLPLIRATLIGSALMVFALSLDEFIVTFFTIGGANTLPIVIWGQMRAGVSPTVNAVSTLMLASTLVIIIAVRRLSGIRLK